MYPVAHVVVASGAAWGAERAARRLLRRQEDAPERIEAASGDSLFDYRLVALGALLPDIIDKPLGWWVLDDPVFEHSVAHSLSFAVILGLLGFLAKGDGRLLSLAFGDVMHLVCDPVMRAPQILFWPLLGWTFETSLGYAFGFDYDLMKLDAIAASLAALVFLRLWYRDRMRSLVLLGRL